MLAASQFSFLNQSLSLTSASDEPEDPGSSTSYGPLTDRQELVAQMVARGETCASIAEQLQVPVRAVEGHVYRILEILDVASMAELTKETIDQYQARLDPPIKPIESEYLTVGEIALNMRVSKMTVYRLVQSGY